MKEKRFYVYVHKYETGSKKGQVFYVGKGCGNRSSDKRDRNPHWNNIVNKYGFVSDIKISDLSEVCAYTLEKIFIANYGIDNLCNITGGGRGVSWGGSREEYCGEGNPRYDENEYDFFHKDFGSLRCKKSELSEKHGVDIHGVYSIVSGKRSHVGGWHLLGVEPNFQKGKQHPFYDDTVYHFTHKDHGDLSCPRHDICKKYSLGRSNLNEMIRGKYKTTKGWSLKNET